MSWFSSGVDEDSVGIVDELHTLLETIGIELGNNESTSGADPDPLRKAGMPIFGAGHDGTHYFDYYYTPDDTLDKTDRDDVNQNVAACVIAACVAANIELDSGRLPVDTKRSSTCAAEDD